MTTIKVDYNKIGLMVGLEIHQQLNTGRKLFCGCSQTEVKEFTRTFQRRLRVSKSEMGGYDPAAAFEQSKDKTITYRAGMTGSCLVEEDEEPPHDADHTAMETVLLIASALGSKIFVEIFPMRKMVIDGSNTSGFQRTMLVAHGGLLHAGGSQIGVQSISLEEDAARLLSNMDGRREYCLDRLGIPLVEIALEPVEAEPSMMREVALSLGRLLRATGRVSRGLGSIRQDVNVSISGGGVVEVKGVQQLDQLEKVIEFEARRQSDLMEISKSIQKLGGDDRKIEMADLTGMMKNCGSSIIQRSLDRGERIFGMRVPGFDGIFGLSPYGGTRLGKEIAQLVRVYGIGGVFHSDELPGYGMTESDVCQIRIILGADKGDGFLVVALPQSMYGMIQKRIIKRIREAGMGVPAETRQAAPNGETVFLRPRPGPARMYPETDVPPIIISQGDLDYAIKNMPRPWDELVADLQNEYMLNRQLAEQILDAERMELFIKISKKRKVRPNFLASVLCSTITSLQRRGHHTSRLTDEVIERVFEFLSDGRITKESVEAVLESVMSGVARTVEEAVSASRMGGITDMELEEILDHTVRDNADLIKRQGERAIGPLMGEVMKKIRGRAPGEEINKRLKAKITQAVKLKI